jgi:hypothetical protein
MLALSANGSAVGTGIVWAVVPLDGDANRERGVKGIVLALDAQDVGRTLWTSEQFSQRDRLGLFAKFTPPLIADGKVFVATYGDEELKRVYGTNPDTHPQQFPKNYYVAVYGLLDDAPANVTIVDQNRDDVAVVRAVTNPLTLDTSKCRPFGPGTLDCTDALAKTSNAPSFHTVIVSANTSLNGCALLRVTTASKDSGLANSTGIGFYSTLFTRGNIAADNSGRFISKEELRISGKGTLLNGASATLHDFVGVTNCPGTGSDASGRIFKPYMQFRAPAPDGRIFRNWDTAEDYRISTEGMQFDRSRDVLRQ